MRLRRTWAALPLLAVLVAGCGDEPRGRAGIGDPVPEYAAVDLDGAEVSLEELRGSPVLFNTWATWCAPCRKEMPALQTLHETYGPRGLRIVGVSIDGAGQQTAIRDFMREFGATFDVWWDPDGVVMSRFGMAGVPTTYLIGPDGTMLWRHLGPVLADDPRLIALLDETMAEG
jgi:cytochrome c biogenesis protein CcmG, thiol:disulfide interchange protein DsbE